MDSLHISGSWWLPDNPTDETAGTLTYDSTEGASLELIGSLGSHKGLGDILRDAPAPRVIHGVADGKRITLLEISNLGKSVSMPGTVKQRFRASLILMGELFPNPEDIRFEQLSLGYTHLHEWGELSGLTITLGEEIIQASFQKPDDIVIDTPYGRVRLASVSEGRGKGWTEYTVSQSTQFIIDLPTPLPFDDCWTGFIHPLRNFLTLATAHPNAPTRVFASVPGTDSNGDAWAKVEILFALDNRPSPERELSTEDMIFGRNATGERLHLILTKWLELSDDLEPVCDLLFGTKYNSRMYTTHRFLSLVQALEAYHRRRYKNEVLVPALHHKRIEEIMSGVPDEHRTWLEEVLRHSNEPRLQQRLDDLMGYVGGSLTSIVRDETTFTRLVKNTRHYLTHFDNHQKKKAAVGADLYWLTRKVHFLLVACLLIEIGFTGSEIKEFFETNHEFLFVKRHG